MVSSSSLLCPNCGAINGEQAVQCFACGQPLQNQLPTEQQSPHLLLKQRYHVVNKIGQGGMGAVYKAEDTELGNRYVAIKEMSQRSLTAQEVSAAAEAFKHEAMLLASLLHPHLPRIYDSFSEYGRWYLVMDFIEGETLEAYQVKKLGLPLQEVLEYGIQLCTVLDYLHTRQPAIIFRDLKPSNIMRTPDGQLYLIDFGIARHFKPGQTRDTIVLGSPGYAAPEQYGKTQTTPRADIYSLGALLHQMLTGNDPAVTPFFFVSLPATIGPPALGNLLRQMLDMDALNRPASASSVKQELRQISTQESMRQMSSPQGAASGYTGIQAVPLIVPYSSIPQQEFSPQVNSAVPATPLSAPTRGSVICSHRMHSDQISALAWSPNGKQIASASYDKTVQIWDTATGLVQHMYIGCSKRWTCRVYSVAWSPDGTKLISGGEDKIMRCCQQVANGTSPLYTIMHPANVFGVAWSPDGSHTASISNRTLYVWKAGGGPNVANYHEHSDIILSVTWSPDSRYLASSGKDKTIYIYPVNKGRATAYSGHSDSIQAIAWSPDGSCLASASDDKTVRLWNTATGKTIGIYHGHGGAVKAVAWSPDGMWIASAGEDQTVQIWDRSGKELFTYKGYYAPIYTVAWSPDGTQVACGGAHKLVQVWLT